MTPDSKADDGIDPTTGEAAEFKEAEEGSGDNEFDVDESDE